MSKFEKTMKASTALLEFVLICSLAGGFEADKITIIQLLLYTVSSSIIAAYVYRKSHDLNNFLLNLINKI